MSGVKNRRIKRWPGSRGQAAWLIVKRIFGGEKRAKEALLGSLSRSWGDNLMPGLKALQQAHPTSMAEVTWGESSISNHLPD